MTAIARESEQILMMACITSYLGKAKTEIAALQVFLYYLHHKRAPVTKLFLIIVFPGVFQLIAQELAR